MKTKRSKVLGILLAVTLAAGAALAQGAAKAHMRGAGYGQHILNYYTDVLDLTDAQQAQMKSIMAPRQKLQLRFGIWSGSTGGLAASRPPAR